ncbi:hypothetical protein ACRRTK_008421 [Alexandromys fortis]
MKSQRLAHAGFPHQLGFWWISYILSLRAAAVQPNNLPVYKEALLGTWSEDPGPTRGCCPLTPAGFQQPCVVPQCQE